MMRGQLSRLFHASRSSCSANFRPTYTAFIQGRRTDVSGTAEKYALHSPATAEFLYEVENANETTTIRAIEAARDTFETGIWSKAEVAARSKVLMSIAQKLREHMQDLVHMEVMQTGRPIKEMRAQLGRLPEWFEYHAALIRTYEGSCPPFPGKYVNYVKRVPLGVCGLLTPWNHPLLIAVKKLAPALATGNSVVLKPSELAPASVLELGPLCQAAGLPDGVLNIVPGRGEPIGRIICTHPAVRRIDLTGGTNTGRSVGRLAGENLCSITSELGGKAPLIIFEDCDLEQAVNGAAFAGFIASGQTCVTGARLLLHHSLYDEFIYKFAMKASRIKLGHPLDESTQMGPVISKASQQRIVGMVQKAKDEKAIVYTGASVPPLPSPLSAGNYYSPTVLGVTPQHEIWREEVFGPVVVAVPFTDESEAIKLANDSCYGLAASIWTKNIMRAHRVADALNVGIIWINDHHRNDPSSPWGGMKESGIGRENGLDALLEYTQSKSVVVRTDEQLFDWFDQPNARYG